LGIDDVLSKDVARPKLLGTTMNAAAIKMLKVRGTLRRDAIAVESRAVPSRLNLALPCRFKDEVCDSVLRPVAFVLRVGLGNSLHRIALSSALLPKTLAALGAVVSCELEATRQ
jgi:hypothetical protein